MNPPFRLLARNYKASWSSDSSDRLTTANVPFRHSKAKMLDSATVLAETQVRGSVLVEWLAVSLPAGASNGGDDLPKPSNKGLPIMKFRTLAAAAALLSMAMPTVATAQGDDLSYEKLTHCAAFNMLLSQVMGAGDGKDKPESKASAETFTNQAAALIVVASAVGKKDAKVVAEEVFAQNGKMISSLSDKSAAEKLIGENLETCDTLGKAAYAAIQENTKK
jgi:hypothetical protein